jgi:hypothetical protein
MNYFDIKAFQVIENLRIADPFYFGIMLGSPVPLDYYDKVPFKFNSTDRRMAQSAASLK